MPDYMPKSNGIIFDTLTNTSTPIQQDGFAFYNRKAVYYTPNGDAIGGDDTKLNDRGCLSLVRFRTGVNRFEIIHTFEK